MLTPGGALGIIHGSEDQSRLDSIYDKSLPFYTILFLVTTKLFIIEVGGQGQFLST